MHPKGTAGGGSCRSLIGDGIGKKIVIITKIKKGIETGVCTCTELYFFAFDTLNCRMNLL